MNKDILYRKVLYSEIDHRDTEEVLDFYKSIVESVGIFVEDMIAVCIPIVMNIKTNLFHIPQLDDTELIGAKGLFLITKVDDRIKKSVNDWIKRAKIYISLPVLFNSFIKKFNEVFNSSGGVRQEIANTVQGSTEYAKLVERIKKLRTVRVLTEQRKRKSFKVLKEYNLPTVWAMGIGRGFGNIFQDIFRRFTGMNKNVSERISKGAQIQKAFRETLRIPSELPDISIVKRFLLPYIFAFSVFIGCITRYITKKVLTGEIFKGRDFSEIMQMVKSKKFFHNKEIMDDIRTMVINPLLKVDVALNRVNIPVLSEDGIQGYIDGSGVERLFDKTLI